MRYQMLRYLRNQQNTDGGWGLHVEGSSTMFGSALNYVTARLLGADKSADWIMRASAWIKAQNRDTPHPGACGVTSWGKFWLAALGVYDWNGLNPLPPELWLLPYWVPLHPGRWWCHCRVVYLPMGYVYGRKGTAVLDPLILSLRTELYPVAYESINWPLQRNFCTDADRYVPMSRFLKVVMWFANNVYERLLPNFLRRWALDESLLQIKQEDRNTNFICIGPVNKTINALSVFLAEGHSEHFMRHVRRMADYLWLVRRENIMHCEL